MNIDTILRGLLAGAGLASGTARGGLLAHFAAGVFMQVLRPFKVGDFGPAGYPVPDTPLAPRNR